MQPTRHADDSTPPAPASGSSPSPWPMRSDEPLALGLRQPLTATVATGVILVVGWLGALSFGLGSGLSAYQPAMTLQAVAGLWFGAWGIVAATVGGILWTVLGSVPDPLVFVPGHIVHAGLCAVVFRTFGFDPRLTRVRDFWAFVLAAVVVGNLIGTALNVTLVALLTVESHSLQWWLILAGAEVFGNGLPCLLLGTAMLKTLSPIVVESSIFCRSWWRSIKRPLHLWRPFRDQPILVKLLVGLGAVALVPIAAVTIDVIGSSQARVREEAERGQQELVEQIARDLDALFREQWNRLGEPVELSEVAGRLKKRRALSDRERALLAGGKSVVVLGPGRAEAPADSLHFLEPLPDDPSRVRETSVPMRAVRKVVRRHLTRISQRWGVWRSDGKPVLPHGKVELPPHDEREFSAISRIQYLKGPDGAYMLASEQLADQGWQVWTTIPTAEARVAAQSWRLNFNAIVASLAVLVTFVVGGYLARTLQQPISRLTETVCQAGRTGLGVRAQVDRHDEVGQLAEAFNQMSDDLARHIENLRRTTAEKERMSQEIQIAADLQRRILPTAKPPLGPFQLGALCVPAREVGGDFYDFIPVADSQVAIVVGDASGKGLAAGFFMSTVRSFIRALVVDGPDPQTILRKVNFPVYHDSLLSEKFMTLLYLLVDPEQPAVRFANAGHPAAICYRAGRGQCELVDGPGLPLGVDADNPIEGGQVHLEPGDVLLVVTDGATEAFDPDNEAFGFQRLIAALQAEHAGSADQICQGIRSRVMAFTRGRPQSDDLTILALKLASDPAWVKKGQQNTQNNIDPVAWGV